MAKNLKTDFQDIHYNRKKPNFMLSCALFIAELGYKTIINTKNFLYDIHILNEKKVNAHVICIGNLTTGGVGKTPIVTTLANKLSKEKKVAIISRGYGAKISNKEPLVIKDFKEIKFENGLMCGDEPYQISKKVDKNVVVITCADRKKAADLAIVKYGIDTIILDDGFSNRKIKKDETYIVIDSKMRFGNNHLLPFGPLREPISQIKRANKIIIVNKGDKDISSALSYAKEKFKKPILLSEMSPKKIYNLSTNAEVKKEYKKVVAFCAIGQPEQFFNFVKEFYEIIPISYEDHHKYTKLDINELIDIAKTNNVSTFITTQKDETKLVDLVKNISSYSFNVLELETTLKEV